MRVFINERVCEGCGDCGVKSNCLSVQPVETEFGRKTAIHQSSCNKDYSCLRGRLPVVPHRSSGAGTAARSGSGALTPLDGRAARARAEGAERRASRVHMMGIGGTGVVTVNQILGTAALLDGRHVRGLDQTGLSQKGGPVVSDLQDRLATPLERANKVSAGAADLYLGFDLLVATDPSNLAKARTGPHDRGGVHQRRCPPARWWSTPHVHFPELSSMLIEHRSRDAEGSRNVYLDAQAIAEALFGDHMTANPIMLGRGLPGGRAADLGRGDRAARSAQRRRGGDEPARLPRGAGCAVVDRKPVEAAVAQATAQARRAAPRAERGRRARSWIDVDGVGRARGACSRSGCPS